MAQRQQRPVFFFDIDNCLYPKSIKIHDLMSELIATYFKKHLSLTQTESANLQKQYYRDYGGSIRGLVLHHKIDALEYNRQVDDALPLDQMLSFDANLRQLLEGIDKSKVKLWLFTNAYKTHGERVVKLLGVKDQFEGMTYCDFAQQPLICKPQPEMFAKAMKEAGVQDVKNCFFIDDSALNCQKAEEIGWTTIHLVEEGDSPPAKQACKYRIRHLEELRSLFPQFFKIQKTLPLKKDLVPNISNVGR